MLYFIISPYSLHASGTEPNRLKTIECVKCSLKNSQGGDFDDLYLDVCVEGLEKDPF